MPNIDGINLTDDEIQEAENMGLSEYIDYTNEIVSAND